MYSIASMALPGKIPTAGGGSGLTPEALFTSASEKAAYRKILDGGAQGVSSPAFKVKKVSVRTFDLSDPDQVSEYEKLWASLLEKVGRMEAVVDSQKDLVKRADGTSYWMKYVEYVEFGAEDGEDATGKEDDSRRSKE